MSKNNHKIQECWYTKYLYSLFKYFIIIIICIILTICDNFIQIIKYLYLCLRHTIKHFILTNKFKITNKIKELSDFKYHIIYLTNKINDEIYKYNNLLQYNKKIEINNLDNTNKLNDKIDKNTDFQNHINELIADMINTMDKKIKELSDSKYQIINLTNKIKELEMNLSNKDNQIEKLNNFINSQTNINNLTTQMINTIDYNQLISRIKSLEDHCCCHN